MNNYKLIIRNISKHFGNAFLFRKISFQLTTGEILAITGWNGSGKSTLLRIIAGLTRPSTGKIEFYTDDKLQTIDKKRLMTGFLSSALSLYDELTAQENLEFFLNVRGLANQDHQLEKLLIRVGLEGWENELYGIFSSGMKQRLKLAQALIHNPPLLLLDEPFSNLDTRGIDIFDKFIREKKTSGIIIIASNEEREIKYADKIVNLSE